MIDVAESNGLRPVPELTDYSAVDLAAARSWPAVDRYLGLIERAKISSNLGPLQSLKIQRHVAWVRAALALFHSRSTDEEICYFWSYAAELNIQAAYRLSNLEKFDVGVFALGKLGAEELNFSSDIDLMIISSDEVQLTAGSELTKAAREFVRILNDVDEWGFCHRVDLALRPGGNSASLVPTISQFENHYGYHGEAWERLAFVRFRHIVGGENESLVQEVLNFSKGFSYRRHLDYSVFEELRILIHRIRSENSTHKAAEEFHLKLHPGGIRDIELFVHALQTIHGGRRRELQTHRTELAISRLAEANLLTAEEASDLKKNYWYYRNIENRLQAENDEQTYRLSDKKLILDVRERANRIIQISNSGFPNLKTTAIPTAENLALRGFDKKIAETALEEIQQLKILSKKSERDEREKNQFLAGFIDSLEKSGGDLDLGIRLLVDFVKTTRAKATLYSMLNREPTLVHQLATLFGVSPWAGSIICSRPELLDSLIMRQTTDISTLDTDQVLDSLAERRLLGELISALHFIESKDLESCVSNLTTIADSIASDLMLTIAREIGCAPIGIVALGKWGGCELGLRSDLDFVFLTDSKPSGDQQRLARRFLNRMTEAHRGGSIYSVDLRLRPSGHAGPILVEADLLNDHLKEKAAAWERQSWLRARSISNLPNQISPNVRNVILDRGLSKDDENDLAQIAHRLFKPIPTYDETSIDLKLVHGGLAPIEFAVQIGVLRSGPMTSATDRKLLETSTRGMVHFLEGNCAATDLYPSSISHLRSMQEMHLWLRRIEQWIRVTGDTAGSNLNLGSSEFRRFVKTSGEDPKTFAKLLTSKLKESAEILSTFLGR